MGEDTEIIRKEDRANRRIWLHGLIAAFIGGFASAGTTGAAALTLGDGIKKSMQLAGVSWAVAGITSAFAYLKQSPVPQLPKDILTTTTVTVKTETSETPKQPESPQTGG